MDINKFDYELSPELIAHEPCFPRDKSKLLSAIHNDFKDLSFLKLPELFSPGSWPTYYIKAKGCNIWDLNKKTLHDFCESIYFFWRPRTSRFSPPGKGDFLENPGFSQVL